MTERPKSLGFLSAALAMGAGAAAMAHADIAPWRNPVRGEGTVPAGRPRRRGYSGMSRSKQARTERRIAYKRQRRADRLRRKALQG